MCEFSVDKKRKRQGNEGHEYKYTNKAKRQQRVAAERTGL